jgi:hypothetical protein
MQYLVSIVFFYTHFLFCGFLSVNAKGQLAEPCKLNATLKAYRVPQAELHLRADLLNFYAMLCFAELHLLSVGKANTSIAMYKFFFA